MPNHRMHSLEGYPLHEKRCPVCGQQSFSIFVRNVITLCDCGGEIEHVCREC